MHINNKGGYKMLIIKYTSLFLLFIAFTAIGMIISEKYKNRVIELKEMKSAFNILETKMKFTYEPLPVIFSDIIKNLKSNISYIFQIAVEKMKDCTAGEAWNKALEECHTNLNQDDINILKGLTSLLGKTSLEGQVSEIKLTSTFLDNQIQKAEEEEKKNKKMYRTLGVVIGLTSVIILI